MDSVYLAACAEYDFSTLKNAVDHIFAALSLERHITSGMKVTLKPNLLMKAKPDSAIVTHPLLTAAVGVKVQELGGTVTIAESAGGLYNPGSVKGIYAACGYEAMAAEYGLKLHTDCSYRTLEVPNGRRSKSFSIITPILDADLVIDIAKLKTHCMTGMSGAVKNMFGAVPGLMKPELHCRFPEKPAFGEMLADLCEALCPRICFVDGILAMEGNGPSGGKPRFVGTIVGGENAFAVDVVCATLMSMNPQDIFLLRSGMERGICPQSMDEIEILGADVSSLAVPDFQQPESKPSDFLTRVPGFLRPIATRLATPIPKIRKRDCIGCAKCAESCPQHTIAVEEKKAKINYKECIRCYCCHEMCPVKAIDIKRFPLFQM